MGNCLRRECSIQGEDEETDYAEKGCVFLQGTMKEEKVHFLGDDGTGFAAKQTHPSTSSSTEVKIKITKKQLQQLLGKMDVNKLTVHEALSRLIEVSDLQYHSHERPWKPALQSIPEVN